MKRSIGSCLLTGLLVLTLSACHKPASTATSQSHASTSSQSTSVASATSASSTSQAKSNQQLPSLNLDQIAAGDYQSLQGQWQFVGDAGHGTMSQVTQLATMSDSQPTLKVTASTLTDGQISLQGQTLTDSAGHHAVQFEQSATNLIAGLKDQDTTINWGVKFYPKGTQEPFQVSDHDFGRDRDLIVIWTSNNGYTEIFQRTTRAATTAPSRNGSGLDVQAIVHHDLSSLIGTWKNPTNGKELTITSQMLTASSEYRGSIRKGLKVAGNPVNGFPRVITIGPLIDGYVAGSLGTFNPDIPVSLEPIDIVPRNVRISSTDHSDSHRDRLIDSAGQAGTKTAAYYRTN